MNYSAQNTPHYRQNSNYIDYSQGQSFNTLISIIMNNILIQITPNTIILSVIPILSGSRRIIQMHITNQKTIILIINSMGILLPHYQPQGQPYNQPYSQHYGQYHLNTLHSTRI